MLRSSSLILVSVLLLQVHCQRYDSVERFSVDLPEKSARSGDCQCISRAEEVEGNKIKGIYEYEDPVGSRIVVFYSMNRDKTDYIEERKVYKNYANSASGVSKNTGLTTEQVVERVLTEITPTTLKVIQTSVRGSKLDLSSTKAQSQLVQTIIIQLRPVVFRIVEEALEETGTYLDAGDLTDLIIEQLTPIVQRGVRQESQKVASQRGEDRKRFELTVVRQVSQSLRPTIIRIIKATVAQSNVDLSNIEALFRTIIRALRPVVYAEVQQALSSATLSYNVDANALTDLIMKEISPFVREALKQEVRQVTVEAPVFIQPPVPAPAPKATDLTSIFGISGKNIVKVDSPTHNYGYETK